MDFKLREEQKLIVQEELARPNLLVCSPMGSGKTLATLVAIATLVYQGEVDHVLIIAPKRVAMSVWEQEAKKYDLGLNVKYCEKAADMKEFICSPATHHVCVCSVSRIKEIPHGGWDMVILDESTLFGNKSSLRSKEVRRICKKVPRRICLTGTPIHGGYEKLWHQIFILDGGRALGKSLTEFRRTYMLEKYKINGVVSVFEMNGLMIPDLMKAVKPVVLNVKSVINLPPLLEKNIYIDLPAKRRDEYKELEQTSVIAFEAESGYKPYKDDRSIIAFSSTSLGMKLRQLASGFVYTSDIEKDGLATVVGKADKEDYAITHTVKVDVLRDIYETAPRGVMVAYQFKSELDYLKKTFPEATCLDTEDDIKKWNEGRTRMTLVHPASAGWGLNLQFGGNIIVWFSLTYDAEIYAQLNKRLHRSGQTDPVSLVHIIARNTIDERVLKILKTKEKTAKGFSDNM